MIFEKFLDVSPYHLVPGRVLVETVSVDNDFHSYLTSLVASQLVVKLHVVEGQVMDLLFFFPGGGTVHTGISSRPSTTLSIM